MFRGKSYPLKVLNLPCVAETYKTYDDVNLVKSADVGQVLVVGDAEGLEGPPGEARDGITRPMRNARERIFRQPIEVDPESVSKVELDLLTILAVRPARGAVLEHSVSSLDAWVFENFRYIISSAAGRRTRRDAICGLRRGLANKRGDRAGRVGARGKGLTSPLSTTNSAADKLHLPLKNTVLYNIFVKVAGRDRLYFWMK